MLSVSRTGVNTQLMRSFACMVEHSGVDLHHHYKLTLVSERQASTCQLMVSGRFQTCGTPQAALLRCQPIKWTVRHPVFAQQDPAEAGTESSPALRPL